MENNNTPKPPPRRLLAELMRIESGEVLPENFHAVNQEMRIYRSSQPTRSEFRELEKYGFRTVLNLRSRHSDRSELRGFRIEERRLKVHILTADDMVAALRIIKSSPKPLLFHCLRGADRTGAVAVGCRVIFENWSLDDALAEMMLPDFGRHRFLYRKLPYILRAFDWNAIRRAVADAPEALPAAEEPEYPEAEGSPAPQQA